MKTLILTASDASAGCLKASQRADATIGLGLHLIGEPPPGRADIARHFGFLPALPAKVRDFAGHATRLEALCLAFDRVELWFDPDANSQLSLALLLDHLRDLPPLLAKLVLVNPEARLADMPPQTAAQLHPPRSDVTEEHLELASAAWRAWQHSTPEALVGLCQDDLSALPSLGRTLESLLAELPAKHDGLGASERILLELAADGTATFHGVLTHYRRDRWPGTYESFAAGQLLAALCHASEPAIIGLPSEAYDMTLFDDASRSQRYVNSILSLSPLGARLLEGRADYAAARAGPRWVGGTELAGDRQWRWDSASRTLHHATLG